MNSEINCYGNHMLTFDEKAEKLRSYIEQLVYNLRTIQFNSMTEVDLDINYQEIQVICYLGKQESSVSMMKEIADYMKLALSTMTGIIDKLINKNLVRRFRSEEDRRVVRVELTENGANIYKIKLEWDKHFCINMLRPLDEDEQDVFLSLMQKIINKVQGLNH